MKRRQRAAEENTQVAVQMVLPPLRLVLLICPKRWEKSYMRLCLCMCVCRCVQNTVYANWHPSEGNNQPQAGNDCDRVGTVDVVYASVVFGPGISSAGGSNWKILMEARFTARCPSEPQRGNFARWSVLRQTQCVTPV